MPSVLRGDCALWYDVTGSGPPLVLAAGLGGTAGWWAPQVAAWQAEFTVLTFDQRGTGRSSRTPVKSIGQMAEDLAAVMDHAGMARAQLLGHSTGAAIALALALAQPARAQSLLIYASTTHGDAYRRRVFALRALLHRQAGPAAYAAMTSLLLYPPAWINANDAELRAREAASATTMGPPEVQASRLDAILAFDPRPALRQLDLPVQLVWAADDILTPAYFMQEFAAHLPNAGRALLPWGGHGLSQTDPAGFADAALPFLRRHAQ